MADKASAPAGAVKEKSKRTPVLSKDDFLAFAQPQLEKVIGARVSKQKAWDIFKTTLGCAFECAKSQPLSLSGVGRFFTFSSQRSVAKGKPALRMRFRPSSHVNELLNKGESFLTALDATPTETPETPAAGKPAEPEL